jgi:hypothetical protein
LVSGAREDDAWGRHGSESARVGETGREWLGFVDWGRGATSTSFTYSTP